MTCYNREKYIASAIESVLASSYSRFELIIVDDGSKDETVKIAKQYEAKDERIKVFANDANLGDYPNRNKAAAFAKGKYIKYVDSDDYIYPNGLGIMVNNMEKFPEAGFGLCSIKPDSERPFPFMLNPKEAYEYHFFGPGLFHKGPLTAIFLKSAFDSMGGFKEDRMISDTDMWHRMALKYSLVLMPDGIVWQRRHEEQELKDAHHYIIDGAKIKWNYLLDDRCLLVNEQIKKIRKMRIKRYAGFVLSGLKHLNFEQVGIYQKCLRDTLKIRI
jgi:glycosyltransferase involved in cell wall biosynthesis